MDQYSHHNNVVVDCVASSVKKIELENKCIEVLGKIDIKFMSQILRHVSAFANHQKQLSVLLTVSFAQKYWQKNLS